MLITHHRGLVVLLLAVLIALVAAVAAPAAVVTLDCATRKAVSDCDDVVVAGVRATGEQIGIYIKNKSYDPIDVTLVANGLPGEKYTLRVDDVDSARTRADLARGHSFTIPGYKPDMIKLRCLELTKPRAQAEADRLAIYKVGDPKRAWNTLNQAADWSNSGVRNTEDSMAAQVFIWPADQEPRGIPRRNRLGEADISRALDRACKLLQMARTRMYNALSDESLRNSTVLAMTPVTLEAEYKAQGAAKPHVVARIVNNTNLPLSGTISMALPKGWKTSLTSLKLKTIPAGQTREIEFDLAAPSRGAAGPAEMPIAANLEINQVIDPQEFRSGNTAPFATAIEPTEYKAQFKLKVVAARNGGPARK